MLVVNCLNVYKMQVWIIINKLEIALKWLTYRSISVDTCTGSAVF